jgi:hypothetical protein
MLMSRENRDFLVFMGGVVVIVTIIVGIGLYVQHRNDVNQESVFSAQRQYVFCEFLKPGMDKNTVLKAIRQFGTFSQDVSSFGESHFDIYIQYDDSQIIGRQLVVLEFRDEKYVNAWLQKGSDRETICKLPAAFPSSE